MTSELAKVLPAQITLLEQSRSRVLKQVKVLSASVERVSSVKAVMQKHPVLSLAVAAGIGYFVASVLFPRNRK